jgi:sialate O-acetylesterase
LRWRFFPFTPSMPKFVCQPFFPIRWSSSRPLTGVTMSGADLHFFPAHAQIQGKKVIVTDPRIARPAVIRFGWADYPVVNLRNGAGLPASPFRTDEFTGNPKATILK